MAKETGMGWTTASVDNPAGTLQDLRDASQSLEWATPRNVIEDTGLAKSAMERLHGLADFSATFSFTFDDAATNSPHSVFADLSNARTVSIVVSGQSLSNECLFTDYSYTRADDGSLKGQAPCVLQSGIVPTWT